MSENSKSDKKEELKDNIKSSITDQTGKKKTKKEKEAEEELSEEDLKLKTDLELLVERLKDEDQSLYMPSLVQLKKFIKNSTSSMTAVPKPLKFLRPLYPSLCKVHEKWTDNELKSSIADVLSVLAMTYSDNGKHDSVRFRMLSNVPNMEDWGHEYLRHLALELGEVYNDQVEKEANELTNSSEQPSVPTTFDFPKETILQLSLEIVPYFLKHNGEADAVDLLLEIEAIDKLPQFVDENTFQRVCQYMIACVPLLPPPEDVAFLQTAYSIYLSESKLTEALTLAIRLGDESLIRSVFDATSDAVIHKQLAYMLSAQKSAFEFEGLQEIIGNTNLSEHFLYLAKELNLTVPKVPEDIYKSHLDNSKSVFTATGMDSAQQNLAGSFVNGLVNLGYSNHKMMTESDTWVYKTKGDGMTSSVANIGSVFQWNLDGLQQLDKFLYVEEPEIKAGALLGIGISAAGVHDGEVEPALLLLQEYVTNSDTKISSAAILGLGIAFAGSQNQEVLSLLLPIAADTTLPIETSVIASLALSHIFVGTCNGDITASIMDNFLERTALELKTEWTRFLTLSLGILYMGQGEQVDDVLETLNAIEHPMVSAIEVLVSTCAYTGTGDVLLIQDLLHRLTPKAVKKDEDDEDDEDDDEEGNDELDETAAIRELLGKHEAEMKQNEETQNDNPDSMDIDDESVENAQQSKKESEEGKKETEIKAEDAINSKEENDEKDFINDKEEKEEAAVDELAYSVLGIAMVALGEGIGKEMSLRHFGHLMHYGNEHIRRMVPLAMGLVSIADPQMKVFDTLSRFSHDPDLQVSMNSIYAMGLCGAGTNNARLAQLLRQLASYYSREQDALFITRLAQGLVHLGKGTMTLDVYNDAHVLNKVTLASLLTVLVGLISPNFMLKHHELFFMLNSGVRPKYIITLNEEGEPIKVNVRVGQAVDTVGQAGKPKTITGWITQSTPVLLNHGERAELETDEYISYASNIEGIVILKKNPDYNEEE
ncbi:hypothetical protein TBLA_0C03150 [Henningerozyma blattae CBS 6284]|uniref:26S proteasome regulatory subunit RPN1 n=1 Tax=Henningerozyma blattae (strain ATCC 34711 / CBS 6284 / DSM 70876 / NBRC 10599 / NRRL Y-10934 / UCD 77-7) TaxID=1071380 RepID=I2H167_HENB6|nr:hypothetical protein TBLA_0C03150 [Tetrapisispora blattae CBS 6284]CCH60119.1 hypothetical protein TBLA_0C03150 [Tetrapisispora blattae CBS 6284]